MAHFAKLGIDNKVIAVLTMDTINTMTSGGIEREDIGIAYLITHHGHETVSYTHLTLPTKRIV